MYSKKLLFLTLIASAVFSLNSCKDDNSVDNYELTHGVLVLNEGKYKSNNAGISYYDFDARKSYITVFNNKNNRGLGDTGQDMIKYGSRIYIAVYGSSLIEVIDAITGKSQKSIPVVNEKNEPAYPRSLTTINGKVNVVMYDGHVAQLDTTSFTFGKRIAVGLNPDKSVVSGNKLYVANTGGYSTKDSTISVIDLTTFAEIKKIEVNLNPAFIHADNEGNIYVLSNGNYKDKPGKFQRIDAVTNAVTDINLQAKGFNIYNDVAYIYSFEYDASYQATNTKIATYDVKNQKLLSDNIITGTTIKYTPYAIDVNPADGTIFVGVTDYSTIGQVYCFSSAGSLNYMFTCGISPNRFIFINK